VFEYALNNSSFTSEQWTAINSGITALLVAKLADLPTIDGLNAMFAAITSVIPSAATSSNKLVDYAQMVAALATKQNTLTFDEAPTAGSDNPVKSKGILAAINAAIAPLATQADLTTLAGRVTTAEGNIISLTGRVSTNEADIAALQALYNALQQSAPQVIEPTDTWPVANPSTTVIYRVIDRVNTPPEYYSDYMWNGTAFVLMATYNNAVDTTPQKDSANLVTSGGIFANIGAFDISEYNKSGSTLATYADLTAALAALPSDFQKGGMSIKFVQSSDNKYVQYRLMANSFSADVADWQGVDDTPTAGSENLVKSDGVYNQAFKILPYINAGFSIFTFSDHYISTDGTLVDLSNFCCTDYLLYMQGTDIELVNCEIQNIYVAVIAFYDKEKQVIDVINWNTQADTPKGTRTILASEVPARTYYFRVNAKVSYTDAYIGYYMSTEKVVTEIFKNKDNISSIERNRNVIIGYDDNIDVFTESGYYNFDGTIGELPSYKRTPLLRIIPQKDIELYNIASGNQYMACVCFFDIQKKCIGYISNVTASEIGNLTLDKKDIPVATYYIGVSSKVGQNAYIEYQYTTLDLIKTNKIVFRNMDGSKELTTSDRFLSLDKNDVVVDYLISAIVEGTVENIKFGRGCYSTHYDYESIFIELTPTTVSTYLSYGDTPILIETFSHGLTLTSKTFLTMAVSYNGNDYTRKFTITTDLGETYSCNFDYMGQGGAFVKNDGTSTIQAQIKMMACNISKDIWMVGDSYFSHIIPVLHQYGYYHWLQISQPGLNPLIGYQELERMLKIVKPPKYLVWCLGMNGWTTEEMIEGEYVINEFQKEVIDAVVSLCDLYGITLILSTIPTVPERQKTGFCNYIKSLGYRYIDMAGAVNANSSGEWNSGLLSNDNIHPSDAGSKVIAAQFFIDFPELSILQ
jgi:hypothetical protein